MSSNPARNCMVAMMAHNAKEAVENDDKDAFLWLASKAAAPWFQHLGIDQKSALLRMNWPSKADNFEWTGEEREFVRSVTEFLHPQSISKD